MPFVHLHVHSQYSFLDGASTLDRLLEKTVSLGMTALAITDHNRLTGAIKFYEKAKKLGIKPIIGVEIELEGGFHLTLLCKNKTGYSNLCRMLTEAHLKSQNNKPTITKDMSSKFRQGIIALSGCSKGELYTLLTKNKNAREALYSYRDIFGDDFFIELIHYPSADGISINHKIVDFARQYCVPVVATNNVHYVDMQEYKIKELLNAIAQLKPVSQITSQRTVEQYLKSPQEMAKIFKDFPDAIKMTMEIASRCNLEFELGRHHFPAFALPKGESSFSYLSRLAHDGARQKYKILTNKIRRRLSIELDTIRQLGFASYFLVVWDIVKWAREHGIRCQARGSAVDSIVVYALDISKVDPIHHNLLFERFMHPLRNEPPDIDIDVDRRRRDEVRDYIYQKYGKENVACVATINTYMARGALRDVGKALQIPQEIINEMCNGIHFLSAKNLLENAEKLPELKVNPMYKHPDLAEFLNLCATIDSFPKHLSVHLGGLIIGDGELSGMVPLERASGGDIISQYDKDDIERLGIIKIDILSLPTMTVIEDAVVNIKEHRNVDIDIDNIPLNDPSAFAMLRDGRTIGTFQLESPAQREMAGRLLPECFNDIIVSISLVRPGPLKSNMDKSYLPRKHGIEKVEYLHPKLKNALGETLGVILYQEQVLQVAHDLAGMSYAEADGFRRAMTHDRTTEEMEKMRDFFIASAIRNNINRTIAEQIFEQLAAFAAYGFCKGHAAAYATISYQTLWLKCHYPAEFLAAVLSNQPMGYYPPRVLLTEAKQMGIKILPLDINKSQDKYTVEDNAIRISLRQLKTMSEEALKSILRERSRSHFTSLEDFIHRVDINENILINLVKAGAFDTFGKRKELLLKIPLIANVKRQTCSAKPSLLNHLNPPAETQNSGIDDTIKERIFTERELLSLDLSAHPLDLNPPVKEFVKMKDLPQIATGTSVKIAGSVIRYQTPPTRNGKRVVYIVMEDGTGIADVTVFSDVQEKCGNVIFREGWLLVEGKVQRRGPKSLSIIAHEISVLKIMN